MAFLPGGFGGSPIGNGLIRIGADISGLRKDVREGVGQVRQELDRGAQQISSSQRRWDAAFRAIGTVAKVGLAGVATAVTAAVAASIQFESSWAGVRKTVDASESELAALRQQFRDLAKEIPVSVNELAKIGETAGALGIAKEDIIEFTRTIAMIGQTTNVTTEEASTALGQLSNVLRLSGKDYSRFADTLVDLGNKGASTEAQILQIASRAGSAAGLIKLSTQDMLAFASSVASLGIEVEAGGSSLQNFFLKMNKYVGSGGEQLKLIAEVAGTTSKQFAKAWEQDAGAALTMFVEGLGKVSGSSQQAVLELLKMNDIRITRMLLGLANGGDLLARNLVVAGEAWEANTAASTEFGKRAETTASQLGLIKNIIQDYLITLGDALLPAVKSFVDLLKNGLPKAITFLGGVWNDILLPPLQQAGEAFGKLGEAIGKAFGDKDRPADWGTVAEAAITGVSNAIAQLVKVVTPLIQMLTAVIDNPIGQWAVKATAAFVGLRLAIGLFNQTVMRGARVTAGLMGGVRGMASGIRGGGIKGLFGFGGGAGATSTPLDQSASALTGSAKALTGAAAALKGAAAAGTAGAAGARAMQMLPPPAGAGFLQAGGRQSGTLMGANGQLLAVGTNVVDRAQYMRNRRAMDAAGKGLVRETAARFTDSIVAGAKGVGGLLKGGLSLVGKAFWPLLVADIATEMFKAPIGGWIESNTKFKRAGAKIKEDFFGGLIDLTIAAGIGSDAFVGRAEQTQIGSATFSTLALAKLGITNANFDLLEAPVGTIENAQGTVMAVDQLAESTARQAGETASEWWARIKDVLPESVSNEIKAVFSDPSNWGKWTPSANPFQPGTRTLTPEATAALEKLITDGLNGVIGKGTAEAREALIKGVDDVLAARGYTIGQLSGLSTDELKKLGAFIQADAEGKYQSLLDFTMDMYLGALNTKTQTPQRLTAEAQANAARIRKALGEKLGGRDDWLEQAMRAALGKRETKGDRRAAKLLADRLGEDWEAIVQSVYKQVNPPEYGPFVTPVFAAQLELKKLVKQAAAAAANFFETVPIEVRQALDAFVAQTGTIDPAIVTKLKAKFGDDWLLAFRDGTAGISSKKDPEIVKELRARLGEDWRERLKTASGLLYLKQGGADAELLAAALRRGINAAVTALKPEDFLPDVKPGDKKPKLPKGVIKEARQEVREYLASDTGIKRLKQAASSDAKEAAKGFDALDKALEDAIPSETQRKKFIESLVALQKTASQPLDPLITLFQKAVPTAADAVGKAAGAANDLAGAVQRVVDWVNRLKATIPGGSTSQSHQGPGRGGGGRIAVASGLVFDTRGETDLTVGEAGSEHVAVLRNFRRISLPKMRSGEAVIGDILASVAKAGTTTPKLRMPDLGGLSRGPRVVMNANTLQLLTPADRRSVYEQLEFLAPDGR